ncbi:hypothetical protein L227DRAFT_258413 [Lentinus tigrinus ALCF2SS1-6]|uniref:Uncharacterized protein n=1 Tax=Lentinus tigrinus ALCF2SS1-6 TaxID=1328759 RepID=A0A5C2RZE8_9APHY|nr:hypothetical protein L227DRAFT_258413 [Lentinus tigrinus ALCF2SS1-6]
MDDQPPLSGRIYNEEERCFDQDGYDWLDQLLVVVAQSSSLQVAERHIHTAFGGSIPLAGDPRGESAITYLEELLNTAMHDPPSFSRLAAEFPVDLDLLMAGAFALYCTICPIPLLSQRLQDPGFLAILEPFLQSPKTRRQTCEVLFSLASKDDCDCRRVLEKTISILAWGPDKDFAPAAVARAASELILASPESGMDVLEREEFRTALRFIKSTLVDQRAPLPALLPPIFRFFHLSLWAAHNAELEKTAVVAELLPILMAFSKSQVISVRCLAIAALLALEPLDALYDRARYVDSGLDERRQPLRHKRLERVLSSVAWQDPMDSPFSAFLVACPTNEESDAAISQHYRSAETDWPAPGVAVADTLRHPRIVSAVSRDVSMSDTQEGGLPCLGKIVPALVSALDDGSDPEAAAIIRLLAAQYNGSLPDLWAQARKAVEQHPTSAYAHCVLSLFPAWAQGLHAVKEGLRFLDQDLICKHDNVPHALRDWLWRRASVQAWEGALFFIGQGDLSSSGRAAQLVAAFVSSAHHDLESILYARQQEADIEALPDKSPELLVWYVLLSVALFGTQIPDVTIDGVERLDIDTKPCVEDSWLQFTWFDDIVSPQSQDPWKEVVNHVDNLIVSAEAARGSTAPLLYDYLSLREGYFCELCKSPAALLIDGIHCQECQAKYKLVI